MEELTVLLRCIECGREYQANEVRNRCDCGGLLDLDLGITAPLSTDLFDRRLGSRERIARSGVWRFRELLPALPDDAIVTKPEGNTNLYEDESLARWAGVERLVLKHEGENPTGSFKDRGMTVAASHAKWTGARIVACASTGNTSASVAAYAALAGIPSIVFVPEGKISAAKLGQTIAYGAKIVQIRGDFDAAMKLVEQASDTYGIYLLNSINPFRMEGQKTILFDLLQQLAWALPEWVVLPGGNLGNSSALGRALIDLQAAGILSKPPRVAVIQAAGASPFYEAYRSGFRSYEPMEAQTVASAIRIGDPVSYVRARRTIELTDGVVEAVSDAELLEAKAMIDRAGIGCEPASATTLAGLRKLVRAGVISSSAFVAGILTGNLMKDTETVIEYHLGAGSEQRPLANRPVLIDPTLDALEGVLAGALQR
ncbi:MAG TPA: threonine synthase [Nitrolancea sp.]|nr:threonine synthase [Nitrolancea sp.]